MEINFGTALITGSSRGIGRAIAVKLAREGVKKIAVHYRTRKDEAEKTVCLVRNAGATGVLVQGDVSDAAVAESLVEEAADKLGGCEIFVHSVVPPLPEIYEHTLSTEVPLAKWQLAFDTQARAFFVGARTAARHMTQVGRILALTYAPGGRTGGWREYACRGCRSPASLCAARLSTPSCCWGSCRSTLPSRWAATESP